MSRREIASTTRLRRLAIGALVCGGAASTALVTFPSAGAAGRAPSPARAAAATKVKQLNQTMAMDVSNIQGNTISAHGQVVSGQINGVVSFHLTLRNGSRAIASFSIFNNGHIGNEHRKGTVLGGGGGSYHVSGAQSYFTGQISNIHGTEEFGQARNLGVTVAGVLNRRTYKLTATLKGKVVE